MIVVEAIDEAYGLADKYDSEHVELLTERPRDALEKMRHYGALFLGEETCASYGERYLTVGLKDGALL